MTRRAFLRSEDGAVVIIAGAAVAAAAGLAAFTVDLSNAYSVKGRLQNAADAAALAAAQRLPETQERSWQEQAQTFAANLAKENLSSSDGIVATTADVVFGQYDTEGRRFTADARPFNAVRVTTRRTAATGNAVDTYFGGLFGVSHLDLEASAIAMKPGPAPCLYALDGSGTAALEVAGSATLWAPNCVIQVNSTAENAAVTRGNGSVDGAAIRVAGNISGSGFTPVPQTQAPVLRDPLRDIPEPAQPGPCHLTDFDIKTSQVLPANRTYCGSAHFSGNAHIQLEPGLYYFKDADIHISSASFTGKDVLIFLDANSSIHISGNGTHELSAAETGPYAGIVIFQSRGANNPINMKSGNSRLALSGAIYMPSSTFQVRGTGAVQAKPGQVKSESSIPPGHDKNQSEEQEPDADGEDGEPEFTEQVEPQPVFTEIELVIALRFDLSGDANLKIGADGRQAVKQRAVLVY